MMEKWLEIGFALSIEQIEQCRAIDAEIEEELPRWAAQPVNQIAWALWEYRNGDPSHFIAYLQSDEPLPERKEFAEAAAKAAAKVRGGRPTKQREWAVAAEARQFYRLWKTQLKHQDISIRGLTDEMKRVSIQYVLLRSDWNWNGEQVPSIEEIGELMDKAEWKWPKIYRRNGR
jgi:hypothetical protein